MGAYLDSGVNFILLFQNLGDWLVPIMQFFTFLGNEEFFLLVMPAVYWCLDASLGIRVGMILMLSSSLNNYFKWGFSSPRPAWFSRDIRALTFESSFGFPSNHAQSAVSVWGYLATKLRQRWVGIIAVFLMLMIGLSRIQLGIHFPTDVYAGWLLGGIVLWILTRYEKRISKWVSSKEFTIQAALAFGVSIAIIFLGVLIVALFGNAPLPEVWFQNAGLSAPPGEEIAPWSFDGLITNAAAFFGLSFGHAMTIRHGGFDAKGTWRNRLLRYLIGLIGVVVLYFGLKVIFPSGENFLGYSFRYLRYALATFWVTGAGPWLFIRMKLAQRTA